MNKSRKKELLKQVKKQEKQNFIESLPFSEDIFEELFNYLDESLENYGCDDTLKYTKKFISENNLSLEESIEWLEEHGGYCDCEVLANIEDLF